MTPATNTQQHSPELLAVAKRMVWFTPPEATLADDILFLNYLMIYGTVDDLAVARQRYDDDFRAALRCALPGIFDARSWAYWHARLDRGSAPPRLVREYPPQEGTRA
jgi:hypothetical protein